MAPPPNASLPKAPPLVRLLVRNAAFGFAVAGAFIGSLLVFDIGGLGTLVAEQRDGPLAAFVLTFATGLTFGSVQMGIAIMQLAEKDEDKPPRGRTMPIGPLAPVRRRPRFGRH
jgi:hypothetical protein